MNCPKCGTQNPEGAQICSSCSGVLPASATQPPLIAAKTSGLAIASLVLAILSPFTCFLTAVPAAILGIAALVKISKSAGQLKGTGFAVIGMVLPVVFLTLVTLLMGILMPALTRTRQNALRVACGANISNIGKAILIYANDYDAFPTSSKWCDLLIEHSELDPSLFCCPGAQFGQVRCSYAMNKNLENFDTSNVPPEMVAIFETNPGWNQAGGPELLTTENHQGKGCYVVYVDCRVEFVKTQDLDKLKW